MTKKTRSKTTSRLCRLAVLALAVLIPRSGLAADAALEKAIHDYILNNPQVILDSVEAYQKKSLQARQRDNLKKNSAFLFEDPNLPMAGNPKADVTVVEFFDYNCGYCKASLPMVQALLEKDKNLRFVLKDLPILGPSSVSAASWALAAHQQGKYFDFHKALLSHRGPITDDLLEKTAKTAGLDVARAKKDTKAADTRQALDRNLSLASSLGLTGTPVFIVGDTVIPGAVSAEEMEKAVAAARAAALKK